MTTTTKLSATQIAAIEKTGADDYTGRADDVSAGLQPSTWAWPLQTSDEAHINAVGTAQICADLGLDGSTWDEIASEWCAAFCRGYRRAHVTVDMAIRPTHVGSRTIMAICDEMHLADRGELVHYAGASYRDDVAWQICLAWLADRSADEATLKSRALKAAWGWDLSPEDLRAAAGAAS